MEEGKILEITINAKQAIAMVWTVFAIAMSLIVVLGFGIPFAAALNDGVPYILAAAFFGVLLVITLPVYLLIALWVIASKSADE